MPAPMLFSAKDGSAVWSNMELLMAEADRMRLSGVAPDLEQRWAVFDTVVDLVHERGRTVYGGVAMNAAVRRRAPECGFYDMTSRDKAPPDIEFYSSDPVHDVVELCRRLYAQGHRYVQGREAAHVNTFTVSVEFVRMCDVTYVPPRVERAIPTSTVQVGSVELRAVEPRHALIDQLRMLSDPHTSHWRLDRAFPRLEVLQRFFLSDVLSDAPERLPAPPWTDNASKVAVVRDFFVSRSTVALVGAQALEFFVAHHDVNESIKTDAAAAARCHVSAISIDFDDDVDAVLRLDPGFSKVEFHPLLDLVGRRTVVMSDGRPVATIIDAAHRAVPVCTSDTELDYPQIASFTTTLVAAMALGFQGAVDEDAYAATYFKWLCNALCMVRTTHREQTGLTIVDAANPFRDFGLRYIGRSLTAMRTHMRQVDERMKGDGRKKEDPWFVFDPEKRGVKRRNFPVLDGSRM